MRNRYEGNCYRCGLVVRPGTGHFERIPHTYPTQWRTQHALCCRIARLEKEEADRLNQTKRDGVKP